jgi:hypothetical protein
MHVFGTCNQKLPFSPSTEKESQLLCCMKGLSCQGSVVRNCLRKVSGYADSHAYFSENRSMWFLFRFVGFHSFILGLELQALGYTINWIQKEILQ